MSKIITSPSKRYPGTVTLAYPLNFPQYAAWRRCLDSLPEAPAGEDNESPGWRIFDLASDPDKAVVMLPAVFEIVQQWDLENMPAYPVTIENFPSTPPRAVFRLLIHVLGAINAMIQEDDEAPLAVPEPLTATPIAEADAQST